MFWLFELRHSSFLRHLNFDIRHFPPRCRSISSSEIFTTSIVCLRREKATSRCSSCSMTCGYCSESYFVDLYRECLSKVEFSIASGTGKAAIELNVTPSSEVDRQSGLR